MITNFYHPCLILLYDFQALGLASYFMDAWPFLVVAPSSMRYDYVSILSSINVGHELLTVGVKHILNTISLKLK